MTGAWQIRFQFSSNYGCIQLSKEARTSSSPWPTWWINVPGYHFLTGKLYGTASSTFTSLRTDTHMEGSEATVCAELYGSHINLAEGWKKVRGELPDVRVSMMQISIILGSFIASYLTWDFSASSTNKMNTYIFKSSPLH